VGMTATTTEHDEQSVWDYIKLPNPHAQDAQKLYIWARGHYSRHDNPFLLFLNIIRWSEAAFHRLFEVHDVGEWGNGTIRRLGNALKEYADSPEEVFEWVNGLMHCRDS